MGKPTGFMEYERAEMGYEPVSDRVVHYKEFVVPLSDADIGVQGARCMDCGIPYCHQGCPVNNIIPDWNDLVYRQDWQGAIEVLHSTNNFPEFTGRICPAPCETSCTLNLDDEPVAIKVNVRPGTAKDAPHVMLLAGAGGRTRKIEVNIDDGSTRTYESGVFLDIVFRLEVRPLAKHLTAGLRGIAIEADGDFGVGLTTQPPGSTTKLDTKTWRVLGQIGYFHRFEKGELGGLIGIGFDRLELETNGTLPSVDYLFLRLGPAYRHFFIDRALYLRVDGGFRYPFSYGDLEATFGPAKGFGFDAALILGGNLDVGFSYAARLSFEYFKPQFAGFPPGMLPPVPGAANGRDATDFAINFHAMVGWAF